MDSYEDVLLSNIWSRINSPDNKRQKDNLKEALVDALVNGFDKNTNGKYVQVCAQGRCNRVLGSMTLLDNDKTISEPIKTEDILRNEIFGKCSKITQNILNNADKDVVAAYNGGEKNKDVDELENKMKSDIIKMINSDYRHINTQTLQHISDDAMAGI